MRDAECRPPEGTPDGTVCWLARGGRETEAFRWRVEIGRWAYWEEFNTDYESSPERLYDIGFRFHSIATPQEDTK
jgi:hypothetical protein